LGWRVRSRAADDHDGTTTISPSARPGKVMTKRSGALFSEERGGTLTQDEGPPGPGSAKKYRGEEGKGGRRKGEINGRKKEGGMAKSEGPGEREKKKDGERES